MAVGWEDAREMKPTLLVVDDEQDMLFLLKRVLEPDLGCQVVMAESGEAALKVLSRQPVDLILADIRMPGMDGLTLLEQVKRSLPDITVVMMTAHGSIETAVEAMKQGAYDFITKPFEHDALIVRLEKALERSHLLRENLKLRKECQAQHGFQGIIGNTPVMQRVFETIRMVAKTDLTVLITGESGTGKELTAKAIHALSQRTKAPFIPINCPTVPENILESELFGYKKGAFTHATRDRMGIFQEADKGTVFLDEIGDISPVMQTKLLRVLQEKEIKPLGDARTVKVDVRIIASTNQDLKERIRQGQFREDFYYRLNVLRIKLPALRQRREDIPLIATHLLEKHAKKLNKSVTAFSPEAMASLMNRQWDGNIRELENVIIRAILFAKSDEIQLKDLELVAEPSLPCPDDSGFPHGFPPDGLQLPYRQAKEQALQHFNDRYIGSLLSRHQGNVTQAAKACGLERQSLQQIMRRYGIRPDDFRK